MSAIPGFNVQEIIYKGQCNTTYRAINNATLKPVLLKVASREAPSDAAMRRELEIIRLVDAEEELVFTEIPSGRTTVLAADMHDMVPLRRYLGSRVLPVGEFLPLAAQLAAKISRLHRNGMVHCGLNTDILLVNPQRNSLQIFDFSHAVKAGGDVADSSPVSFYSAPAQTGRVNRPVDCRSDIYALGVVFYEITTGCLPVSGQDPLEWFHTLMAREIKPPHELRGTIPPGISGIIMKCLARDPGSRYQSAVGVKNDLRECLAQWEQRGRVDPFVLGRWDIPAQLKVTDEFIGKEREIGLLSAAMEKAGRGPGQVLLIAGEAGVGKTRLVREFMKRAEHGQGFFIAGKYPTLDRSVPNKPVVDALNQALDRILAGSRHELAEWRKLVPNGFGNLVAGIAEMLPRLGQLVGEVPDVAVQTTLEAREHSLYALAQFVRLLARKGAPLVFFLDDLQWADPASLKTLESLLIDNKVPHLLLIGAYRKAEAAENGHFMEMLRKMEREPVDLQVLELEPATREEVTSLVAGVLGCGPGEAGPLAQFVWLQTGGNMLFVNEMLDSMHRSGLIVYDGRRWRWDLHQLENAGFAPDLVQFLLDKLNKLPVETKRIIQLAACAGYTFPAELIGQAYGEPGKSVAEQLTVCLNTGLIAVIEEGVYRFVHDRIHQAAYLSLPADERPAAHYRLGRIMLAALTAGTELFDAVNQINLGLEVLKGEGQGTQGAELNLQAGQKAKRALAFASSLGYLRTGLSLLDARAWETSYPLVFRLNLECMELEYLCGEFAVAEALYAELAAKARTRLDRADVHLTRIRLLFPRRMNQEITATGVKALRELGCPMPSRPSAGRVLRALWQTRRIVKATGVDRLTELPPATDPEMVAIMDLLAAMCLSGFQTEQRLMILPSLKMLQLSIRHGYFTDSSGIGFMTTSLVFLYVLNDYRTAVALAETALGQSERMGSADKYVVGLSYGGILLPWVRHAREAEPFLARALEYSLAAGDMVYARYIMLFNVFNTYSGGAALSELTDRVRGYQSLERRLKHQPFGLIAVFGQLGLALQGLTRGPLSLGDAEFDEEAFYRRISADADLEWELHGYILCKGQLCYLMGEHHQALSLLAKWDSLNRMSYKDIYLADQVFYYCLAFCAAYPGLPAGERVRHWPRFWRKMRRLKLWARHCPANFEHRYLLVAAEAARLFRQRGKAARLYDRAIASAREHGYQNNAAVACECAALFYLAGGLADPARAYLRGALDGYRAWGAHLKADRLTAAHPWLAEKAKEKSDMVSFDGRSLFLAVDVSAVLSAARTLSEEVVPEELLPKMMRVALQNAGADRGWLLIPGDGRRLAVVAAAQTGADGIRTEVLTGVPPEGLVPLAIVDHAAVTGGIVVLDDSSRDERFGSDPCLASRGPVSVLCLPVIRKDRLLGLLYLENSRMTGCFHPGRVETLKVLAAQMAISIENASLYRRLQEMNTTLEDKVRERTASLAQMRKETMKAYAEQSRLRERTSIAREIHDTVGHTLTAVLVQIEAGKRLLQKDAGGAVKKLEQAQQQLREGLGDIRRTVHLLGAGSGTPDLETLLREVMENTGVAVSYRLDPLPGLDSARRYVLYRVLQEGITNGIRHGRAESFDLSLTEEKGLVKFLLRDSGVGSDGIRFGFGLNSMRERVKEFGGTLRVDSRAGEGCRIEVTLPLP